MYNKIKEKIVEYICLMEDISKEKIAEDSDLIKDIGMDSLDIMELLCYLEEEFDVCLEKTEEKAPTIKNMAEAVLLNL